MIEPVTRKEHLLSAIAAGGDIISPVTREEMYLAYMAGDTSIVLPEPVTRKEQFLHQACLNGGSGGVEINNQDKTITENGEYTADAGYTGLGTVTVNVPISGGETASPAKWNDVTFIDYDGSVLYSYSLAEAQALTELPALPTHDGLVCQGWNWTLEKINALTRPMNVGAMYITDDGKTRLHIRIATEGRMNVPLYISQTVANGVTIDWGDGSTTETLAGTGNVNTTHAYASIGDYVIMLDPADGCTLGLGCGSSSYCVLGSTGNNGQVYCNMLQDVQVGTGVTSIANYAFSYCHSLASITIPDSVTSIGNSAFYYCHSLASVTIPYGVTSIEHYAFYYCYSLASITIPDSVTSIGSSAFQNCYGMAKYHLKPTTPPTLSSTSAFSSIPSDCIIYVPQGCLEAYQNATNWTTYASYMQEEPA